MILALLLALQAPIVPGPPPGWTEGDWVVVLADGDARLAIDRAATRRAGAIVETRLRADFPTPHRGIRWGMSRIEIGCDDRSSRAIEVADYGADGAVQPRPASPPTTRERLDRSAWPLLDAICREAGWRAPEAAR